MLVNEKKQVKIFKRFLLLKEKIWSYKKKELLNKEWYSHPKRVCGGTHINKTQSSRADPKGSRGVQAQGGGVSSPLLGQTPGWTLHDSFMLLFNLLFHVHDRSDQFSFPKGSLTSPSEPFYSLSRPLLL